MHMIPASISIKRIMELFDIRWGKVKPQKLTTVILDLNSAFNTICRVTGLAEYGIEKYLTEINYMVRDFINKNLDKKIIILYNLDKTYLKDKFGDNYLSFFYDDRNKTSTNIMNMFISRLNKLNDINNINVVNCRKFEPAILIYALLLQGNTDILILSRNWTVLQLINEGGYYWDGRMLYHKSLSPKNIHSEVEVKMSYKFPTELPFSLYSYYMCMRGLIHHGHTGVARYGEQKTVKYLTENFSSILDETDTVFDYEEFKYFNPSEFILKCVLGNDELSKEYKAVKAELLK